MVSVKFIKPWSAYSPGDIAGFDEERARALIKCGAAELYEPATEENASVVEAECAPAQEPGGDSAETAQASEAKPSRKQKAQ